VIGFLLLWLSISKVHNWLDPPKYLYTRGQHYCCGRPEEVGKEGSARVFMLMVAGCRQI
jgi:hypothetical protein